MHARAKLTVLGRRLLVERSVAEGWPVARAAEAQGVSVATAYKWLHHYNYHCPHTTLGGHRPMQVLNNLPGNHT